LAVSLKFILELRAKFLICMKRFSLSLVSLLFICSLLCSFTRSQASGSEQKKYALYGVAFYNLENCFDTLHDEGKNDYEYLPNGTMQWGKMKYEAKLKNMSHVLSLLCTDKLKAGAAVLGLSEVENENVLRDLLAQPELKDRGYKYVDFPGVDRRGIECAFLYNSRFFQLESSMIVPYCYGASGEVEDTLLGFYTNEKGKVCAYEGLRGDTTYITRGFLVMEGKLAGEPVSFIVNHWPSRAAGDEVRQRAAWQVRQLCLALMKQDPAMKVVVMGDMNDDPGNKSMTKQMGCVSETSKVKRTSDFYNPWYNTLYKTGQGTLLYDGKWNLFDQIVMSGNMIGNDRSSLKFYQHAIFMRDWLFQQEGKYKGSPLRTHASGTWLNGYSDHLPVQVYLIKEVK